MPEISLREYETEIDQLIEEARYLEALAHVRHIISLYPRYIGAYYLMGKMLLEADQPFLAVDMFRRALNADPEHLKSRIGLGLAHEQRDDLDAAIWNLERAFELAPANADIADELRRIYGRRDGKEPDHIPISRAGLSRLYMRGNLSSRAVDELRNLLAVEPTRPDLLGALAEAYWRDGQIVQAAETCQSILDDMPYHRKANLLLGTLWLNSGQEEGQVYLNRSQEVDVNNALAVDLLGASSPLQHREVFMDRLVYDLEAIDVDQQAKWFKHLEAASVSVGISEAVPEMSDSDVRLVDITAGLESQIEIPDWLRELGSLEDGADQEGGLSWMSDMTLDEELRGRDTALEVAEPPAVEVEESEAVISGAVDSSAVAMIPESTEGSADWLNEFVAEELDDADEEVPDWLEGITPEPRDVVPTEQPIEETIESVGQIMPGEVEVDLSQAEAPEVEVIELAFEDEGEETPDWLESIVPPSVVETEEQPQADIVTEAMEISIPSEQSDQDEYKAEVTEVFSSDEDYIEQEELAEISEQPLSEPISEVDTEAIPDWLQTIAPTVEEAVVVEQSDEGEAVSAGLDWIEEIVAEIDTAEVAQPESTDQEVDVSEEVSDWLQAIAPATEELSIGELATEVEPESTELDWLEEITADLDTAESGEFLKETSADVPDWLQAIAPAEAQADRMEPSGEDEGTELDWLEEITTPVDTVESTEPLEEKSGDVPDWLQSLAPAEAQATVVEPSDEGESTEFDWLEEITAESGELVEEKSEDLPDWLQALAPAEAQATAMEPSEDKGESTDFGWLEEITAEGDTAESDELVEEKSEDVPDWLQALAPAEAQATVVESSGEGEGESTGLDWLEGITAEIDSDEIQRTQPLPEVLDDTAVLFAEAEDASADDDSLDWLEQIAIEAEQQSGEEQEATPEWLREQKPAVSPDESPAETLTSAESIPDWISELQPATTETEKFTLSEEEIPDLLAELGKSVEEDTDVAPAQELEPQKEGDFFGWQAFGDGITEVTPTIESEVLAAATSPLDTGTLEVPVSEAESIESGQPAEEQPSGMFGWDAFGESITEATPAAAEIGGDVLSGDDALAWLESLTAGKEEELRAQTDIDAEARMAEILGRSTTPVQEEGATVPARAVMIEEPEAIEAEEPVAEEVEPEPVAEAEGEVLSGDDTLAWLESLTIGKEEELRAQTEIDAEARMAEILGRSTTPVQEEIVEELTDAAVPALAEELATTEEAPAVIIEEPVAAAIEPEPVAEAEGEVLSGDDALAWLESLTIGKEEELRAQTEIKTETRMAEILGRSTLPIQEEAVKELTDAEEFAPVESVVKEPVEEVPAAIVSQPLPEPEVTLFEEPVIEEAVEPEPVAEAEGDVLSGDDALAWLESLTIGKEEELRAQTEIETETRMAEILGRSTPPVQEEAVKELTDAVIPAVADEIAPVEPVVEQPVEEVPVAIVSQPLPEPEVTLFEEPVIEAIEPEPVAEAEGDVLSSDDALAWLESLTIGKEEELRAQTEIETETRMAEILGRSTPPVQEEVVKELTDAVVPTVADELAVDEEFAPEEPVVEQPVEEVPAAIVSQPVPEPEVTLFEEPAVEAAEPELEAIAEAEEELVVEEPAFEEPEPEPVAEVIEEPAAETLEPELEAEAPAVEEPEPESVAELVEEPAAEVVGPAVDELEDMRNHLKRKRSDHETRLEFSRALWSAGDIKEAMKNYGTLIKSGAKMGEIYEDLQEYLQTHPKDSDVLRTLGDAYMKDGDLDRALEIYNEAMSTL